jgi:hypothetical protein
MLVAVLSPSGFQTWEGKIYRPFIGAEYHSADTLLGAMEDGVACYFTDDKLPILEFVGQVVMGDTHSDSDIDCVHRLVMDALMKLTVKYEIFGPAEPPVTRTLGPDEYYSTKAERPEYGKLYICVLANGAKCFCRYGYHRKNNDRNWKEPMEGTHPSVVWRGWRNHETFEFYRPEEIKAFAEYIP